MPNCQLSVHTYHNTVIVPNTKLKNHTDFRLLLPLNTTFKSLASISFTVLAILILTVSGFFTVTYLKTQIVRLYLQYNIIYLATVYLLTKSSDL